jgi:hypothetical protein
MNEDTVIADIISIANEIPTIFCQPISAPNPAQSPYIQFAIWGAGSLTVTDGAGHALGVDASGLMINTIPGASYYPTEGGLFTLLPASGIYTLTITQSSDQPVLVKAMDMISPAEEDPYAISQQAVFLDVPSAPGGIATASYTPGMSLGDLELSIDLDNNGTPDASQSPTALLDHAGALDFTPPVTSIEIQGSQDAQGFYYGEVTVTLLAGDNLTGVHRTYYSLDAGLTWLLYADPLTFQAEDVPIFMAYSVDQNASFEFPFARRHLRPGAVLLPIVMK